MSRTDDFSGPLRITGETNPQGGIIAPTPPTVNGGGIQDTGNPPILPTDLWLVGGKELSNIIPGDLGLVISNNANTQNNLALDNNGNLTLLGQLILGGAAAGGANTLQTFHKKTTGIADSAATSLATITVPNGNCSALLFILVRTAITNSSHTYDSTRVQAALISLARVAAANLVAALSSVFGAQIATVSGGQTLTSTLSLAAVAGGTTATNTVDVQVTNVNGSAGTTDASIFALLYNDAGGATIS